MSLISHLWGPNSFSIFFSTCILFRNVSKPWDTLHVKNSQWSKIFCCCYMSHLQKRSFKITFHTVLASFVVLFIHKVLLSMLKVESENYFSHIVLFIIGFSHICFVLKLKKKCFLNKTWYSAPRNANSEFFDWIFGTPNTHILRNNFDDIMNILATGCMFSGIFLPSLVVIFIS